MKVTIVGAGNMGRGIATRAVAGGHEVEIIARDPSHAQKLAEELGGSATALQAGAPFGGDVVVFAVYYPGIKDAVQEYADQLAGKVVVDITNPLGTQTWDSLVTPAGTPRPRRSPSSSVRAPRWSRRSTPPSPPPWWRARSATSGSTS